MNVPLIFMAVIICIMAVYLMNRYIRRPGIGSILVLLIQFLAATIIVFSILENVLTTPWVEFALILAGVILPTVVIAYDHIVAFRKRREKGVSLPLVEKKEKKMPEKWNISAFTQNAELWKEEIHAMEVYHSLSVQDSRVLENVKKQAILTQRLINLERYETAAEQYRFLFSILPDSVAIAYNAGYLHCFVGKYRESYKILRRAYGLIKKGRPEEKAPEDIDRHSQRSLPEDLDAMIQFNMGYALYHLGKYEYAIRHFQKVLDTKPDLAVACKNIARSFISLGLDDKAIEYMEKGRMDLRDSQMRVVLGSIYYRKGNTKKALEVLDEAARADTKQIEILNWRGKAAVREKMFDKAIECFTRLIQMDPSDPTYFYHLALAQRSSDKYESALKTYEAGIAEYPTSSMLLLNAGTLLDEMGQKEKAADYLYRSLKGNELLEDAMNYLGVLLGQMQRYREAVEVYEKGIHSFPNSYQLYFNRGIVLEMARRSEDAAVSFEKAYELNRQDPVLIYYYTATLLKLRNYTKAIRICKSGLSNYPDDAEMIYGLSKVYAHMGEKDITLDLLKKVLELDSDYLARIKQDVDFRVLYKHPGYRQLMVS